MKRSSLVFAGIALILLFAMTPLTGEKSAANLQTYTIDSFDNAEELEWKYDASGSKFVVDGYPKLTYTKGLPRPLEIMHEDKNNAKVLGMEVKFNRKGNNWIDIYPTKEGDNGKELYEVPFKGIIKRLEIWVWGAGYLYDLEVLVRDCEGRVHTLPMGCVNFKGWKSMTVSVPTNIPQASKYLGNKNKLTLVSLRVRTHPAERVDDFKIFFDDFKALSNMYVDSFDGFELAETDFDNEGNGEKSDKKVEEEQ